MPNTYYSAQLLGSSKWQHSSCWVYIICLITEQRMTWEFITFTGYTFLKIVTLKKPIFLLLCNYVQYKTKPEVCVRNVYDLIIFRRHQISWNVLIFWDEAPIQNYFNWHCSMALTISTKNTFQGSHLALPYDYVGKSNLTVHPTQSDLCASAHHLGLLCTTEALKWPLFF